MPRLRAPEVRTRGGCGLAPAARQIVRRVHVHARQAA
jgi:hypothetical protein